MVRPIGVTAVLHPASRSGIALAAILFALLATTAAGDETPPNSDSSASRRPDTVVISGQSGEEHEAGTEFASTRDGTLPGGILPGLPPGSLARAATVRERTPREGQTFRRRYRKWQRLKDSADG